jgi:hypothetical protein
MDRVGFEPTTSALYSLLKWRLMNENSTAGQIHPVHSFSFCVLCTSVDESMEHSKQGFALLSNLIRFPEDFVFLVTQK